MDIPGYQLQEQIGEGGMATVYRAVQTSFERQVAIKLLSPSLQDNTDFSKRFIKEARIVAQLNHPHIVPVFDVGEHAGQHYMTMEYVAGGSLKQRIKQGMTPQAALRVLSEIASALDYAGDKGFIHRDIKPDNIMFREDDSAVLMDFGIARAAMQTDDDITRIGTIIGTPKYMSPEQHRGKTLDNRSDLYSLGVVFFEMLTGKPPFSADDAMGIGMKHLTEPVPVLPKTLKMFQPLVRKLLAKTPEQRFQSGAEIVRYVTMIGKESAHAADDSPSSSAASTPPPASSKIRPAQQPAQAIQLEPRLRIQDIKEKAGLLSSQFVFDIYLSADDFAVFQKHFETVSAELSEWHQKHGKKCGRVQVKAIIHPWIVGRVKEYFRNLRSTEAFAFLQRIPVQIKMVAASGEPIEQYTLTPDSQS